MKKEDIKKFNLKEKWKDKRERAKIELALYGLFFLIIIIFVRVNNSLSNNHVNVKEDNSFIELINDNYEYNIDININDEIYNYNGKVLGYNSTFVRKNKGKEDYFYKMNDKYYILDVDGNYLLTAKEDIYSVIDYNYLDINTIKEYIMTSSKNNNTYLVKISDIILNSDSSDNIIITLNEENNSINIDYTNLLKIKDSNVNKAIVDITYSDIDKVITLAE